MYKMGLEDKAMDYSIITISREFGTGARLIGRELSALLGFGYYDRALIEMAAEKSGRSEEFIERTEEKASNSFLYNLATAAYISADMGMQYSVPVNDRAFMVQSDVIRDIAKSGNSIIVGRCADFVLKDHPKLLRVFLYANKEDRLNRIINEYGQNPKTAESTLNKIDKGRANYHKFYTGTPWKSLDNYDLCINTSATGISGAVKAIKAAAEEKFGL
jgi:cytidylate kinase